MHSLSDVVREAAASKGLSASRTDLIATGVHLRREGGGGVLAERIVARLAGRAVVDSIRGPAEVAVLRGLPGFLLLGIDAPPALRFERSRVRGRLGDGASLEEFLRNEERENADDESGQQLRRTLALADRRVMNDGSLELLHERTLQALADVGIAI